MSLCLACGAANPLDTKFCSQCRTRLLIQDRYRALRIIGQGGFGKTFLAQDEGKPSKPKCVIKQFTYTGVGMQKASELFQQEAAQLEKLGKHSQIPELLAHTEQQERQYLVQEFIDGQNIAQEVLEHGAFNETKIREFLLDILPVLDFLHSHQVIHRDIKPENIIRRRSDQKLVLVDFGAAKQATLTALAKTGTVIGSPEYTAPEQARGKTTFASDIYSLGVTCLNLLTLCSPFDLQDSDGEWVWRDFLNGKKVSPELEVILDKSVAPLSKRYGSAAAMLKVLNPPQPSSPKPQITISQPSVKPQVVTSSATNGKTISLDLGNRVILELLRVPAGSFAMGSNEYDSEKPIHQVNLKEFFIWKYAVTNQQWQAVMKTKGSANEDKKFQGDLQPVVGVSWHEAREFCNKIQQQTGRVVRLPSEAEWEYAARGGNQSKGFTYAGSNNIDEVAWHSKTYWVSGNSTHPVGQKKANELGTYDMSGNISEWCLDEWHESYANKPENLKKQGNEPWGDINVNKNDNRPRLLRGGCWYGSDCFSRAASRKAYVANIQYYKCGHGFRVSLVISS